MSPPAYDGVAHPPASADFAEVVAARLGRRAFLAGGLATATVGFFGRSLVGVAGAETLDASAGTAGGAGATTAADLLGFAPVAMTSADTVTVPPGYGAAPIYRWGDPVNGVAPPWRSDATATAPEQARQAGMHTDGMHWFPFDPDTASEEGLLVTNHEYTDDNLLHVGGMTPWTAAKVAKSQAAHGVSIVHLQRSGGAWQVVDSPYSRRITASTPMTAAGPAAGHPALRTAADPTGAAILGTVNNCAHGVTPWGTYLTCEENFNGYFVAADPTALQRRYGISAEGAGYRWHEHDPRFDAGAHPNEPNRFGWVVEINPWDPDSTPVKRTALGRFKHEGAFVTEAADGRAVVYSGDDERFEYLYKYVSAEPWRDMVDAGISPLDDGTLHVATFAADGTGRWLPMVWGQGRLDPGGGFPDPGTVLVAARLAADALGATRMDRPEWIAQDPIRRAMYCSLTNNTQRGDPGRAGPDAANPRAKNAYGQIVRWYEDDLDAASATFSWDLFLLAGDPALGAAAAGTLDADDAFGSPDGLWFDPDGRLWIQTDVSTSTLGRAEYANLPNNQMLAADPATGELRRFLVGPKNCEVTGLTMTPDQRTMFVGIQHPGEPPSERSDPAAPLAISTWPDRQGRPRSAVVVITRDDGGIIGA